MNSSEALRAKRKDLVVAAEAVIKSAFIAGKKPALKKSQLNHLIGICGEASCSEEIENYIRYQAGRGSDKTGWDLDLAHQVLDGIREPTETLNDTDRLSAWALYAVYLTRAFTYQSEANNENKGGGDQRDRGGPRGFGKDRSDTKGAGR